ncbi:hypothetical protein GWI33_014447 [Rhynchophorus ferrugineus]|uniref:Uncharacterized protein n=1 Tax=Rhynchophorus ferrugineus TaxID=354439 RepID=A0A834I7D0_RHYFE|nr:hypothetical protein GWI33_014447 [Rhynchophorus ferrugineus]
MHVKQERSSCSFLLLGRRASGVIVFGEFPGQSFARPTYPRGTRQAAAWAPLVAALAAAAAAGAALGLASCLLLRVPCRQRDQHRDAAAVAASASAAATPREEDSEREQLVQG